MGGSRQEGLDVDPDALDHPLHLVREGVESFRHLADLILAGHFQPLGQIPLPPGDILELGDGFPENFDPQQNEVTEGAQAQGKDHHHHDERDEVIGPHLGPFQVEVHADMGRTQDTGQDRAGDVHGVEVLILDGFHLDVGAPHRRLIRVLEALRKGGRKSMDYDFILRVRHVHVSHPGGFAVFVDMALEDRGILAQHGLLGVIGQGLAQGPSLRFQLALVYLLDADIGLDAQHQPRYHDDEHRGDQDLAPQTHAAKIIFHQKPRSKRQSPIEPRRHEETK